MATISPRSSDAWAAAMAASVPSTVPPWRPRTRSGGRTAAQATGWAWKRRSAGSWYSAAQSAHRSKPRHGGVGPVVGEAERDGESGPAIGAVDEGVASRRSPGSNISARQSSQTATSGETNVRTGLSAGSRRSGSRARAGQRPAADSMPKIRASGGASATEARLELTDCAVRALDLDEDALGVVAHMPGQAEFGGQSVHERSETHSLDDAPHPDPAPHQRRGVRLGQRGHAVCLLRRPRVTAASRCIRPKL